MNIQRCTRRAFFGIFTVLGTALALRSVPISAGWTDTALSVRLAGLISSRESAHLLREYCLSAGVEYRDPDAAITYLEECGGAGRDTLLRMSNNQLREYVRNCVRMDHVSLRVVVVDGWLLSEAEARILSLCGPSSFV